MSSRKISTPPGRLPVANHKGWIKLHRDIQKYEDYFSEKFTRSQAWIDLNLIANNDTGFVRKRGIKIQVDRAHLAWSEESLAERWKWSRDKVRRYLDELEKEGLIARKAVQQNPKLSLLIHLLNYEQDQERNTTNNTTEKQQTDNRPYTNKNNKNEKNDKKIFIHMPTREDSPGEGRGEDFPITEDQVLEWEDSFPGMNVREELKDFQQQFGQDPPFTYAALKGGILYLLKDASPE